VKHDICPILATLEFSTFTPGPYQHIILHQGTNFGATTFTGDQNEADNPNTTWQPPPSCIHISAIFCKYKINLLWPMFSHKPNQMQLSSLVANMAKNPSPRWRRPQS